MRLDVGQVDRKMVLAALLCIVAITVCGVVAWRSFRPIAAFAESGRGDYICAKTGRSYQLKIKPGLKRPAPCPCCDQPNGYPAEFCYWTVEGTIREKPVAVLLNMQIGVAGPTFCPDCRRLVRSRNPRPIPGDRPPPTIDQFKGDADE